MREPSKRSGESLSSCGGTRTSRRLQQQGVPANRIEVAPGQALGTYEESLLIRDYATMHKLKIAECDGIGLSPVSKVPAKMTILTHGGAPADDRIH